MLYPDCWPKVILLGDSLTQFAYDEEGRWGSMLASLLKRKADILNRGFSGYNTNLLKLVVKRMYNAENLKDVAGVVLCIGANDSWFPTSNKFNPGLPVKIYKENLMDIINYFGECGLPKEKILLITPPTIQVEKWNAYCEEMKDYKLEKTPEHTKKYVDAMLSLGQELGIKVFDAFELTSQPEHISRAFIDGLHFSNFGARILFDLVKDEVEKLVIEYRKSDLENYPTYDCIDYNNLENFFS